MTPISLAFPYFALRESSREHPANTDAAISIEHTIVFFIMARKIRILAHGASRYF
jgi:hypothetical protein